MEKEAKLCCKDCGSDLVLNVGYDGCDWNSKDGEGSEFGWEISLNCENTKCKRTYPIGRLKNENDFCESIEKLRPYKS